MLGHSDVKDALTSHESYNKDYSRGFDRNLNSGDASERRTAKRCTRSALVFDRSRVAALADERMASCPDIGPSMPSETSECRCREDSWSISWDSMNGTYSGSFPGFQRIGRTSDPAWVRSKRS